MRIQIIRNKKEKHYHFGFMGSYTVIDYYIQEFAAIQGEVIGKGKTMSEAINNCLEGIKR